MTTRANKANLSPKGTTHAPAKPAPKGAKSAPQAPSKAPAKASKPVAPSATKAHHTANQPGKVTAASVSAKLDAAKPSGPLGLTPADIRTAQTDPRNQRPAIPPQVPTSGPYSLDATQAAAAKQIAAAHTATLIAVKRMSAEERRYAKNRIESVIHAKNVVFKREREDLNRWGTINRLYTAEIAAGRFTIDMTRVAKSDANTQLGDVVCLTSYPQGLGKHVQSLYDALDARQEAMKLEGARMLDEIMLGSPADAIERIQHFENTKF